ncbi:GntR family transcriptional regulator [Micromonospora sp. WMMD1082]|uniref:GntR family transcriptional regulator n=1 Tax=Micromonospora sp. WMMD1082 TaxID=3016104 RepID=UPI0024175C4F|nr:GntR family transcriptional regulator [Micromonospora sp. WMMD1082]MDG4794884.1 GntR family transcriptional regulator [Micromonospora sp. WMMD1082]
MASGTDGRPRHEQIAADLRARIMSGDLAPGAQLPSIPILVTQYSAATATVQRALAALKAEGSVYSAVGKGVYVRDRRPLAVEAAPYLALSAAGFAYRLLAVREVVPPIEVAEGLELAGGDRAVLRHRLLLHGGEPVELSWSYYPAGIARGTELAERSKISGGVPRVLSDLGYPPQEMQDRVSARMPTTEEVEALSLPAYVPVLRQFRVIRSIDDRPVEASVLVKGSHLHELRYRQSLP